MDQPQAVEVFVAGVAVVGGGRGDGCGGGVEAVTLAAFAPGVVAQAFDEGAGFTGDGVYGT